jgi:hypothetical protein
MLRIIWAIIFGVALFIIQQWWVLFVMIPAISGNETKTNGKE